MTDLLWMPAVDARMVPADQNPNYLRAFSAKVQKATGDWILLDRTAFYAEGGGQPSDRGKITWDGGEAVVRHVTKRGAVKHTIEGDLPPVGAQVHGEIDWQLRHDHMRMHTAQHLLSAIVWNRFQAHTVGNQIHADHSRVDFDHKFTDADLSDLEAEVNALLRADLPVRIFEEDRATIEQRVGDRALLKLVPQSVRRLRIVEILDSEGEGAVDFCPCAGTHVARTGEIGLMRMQGRETKGSDRDRVTYELR